jgi:acyl CoA:acetate/3-ketoacid CoA transferase
MRHASFSKRARNSDVTWVIEQGAIDGVPLLDFQFGCAANAEGRRLSRRATLVP